MGHAGLFENVAMGEANRVAPGCWGTEAWQLEQKYARRIREDLQMGHLVSHIGKSPSSSPVPLRRGLRSVL